MKRTLLYLAVLVFAGVLGLSWFTHGTGVMKDDESRNIVIPKELTAKLLVKVAYNGKDIFFRYRWPTEKPSIYHGFLKFEGGKWVREVGHGVGPDPKGMIEDRIAMLVDDGSVPEFARYGGYITIGDRMRFFSNAATDAEVKQHPYLGQKLKKTDVRKYLPATRRNLNDWASVVPEDELKALRKAGYFLDLWQWRAARSNPISAADDESVFEYRSGDAGKAPFDTNWDAQKKQPRFMFNREKVGRYALSWDDIKGRKLGFDDIYYISEDIAVPFDARNGWKDGDSIPQIILRKPTDSHGDVQPVGPTRWKDGYWDVTLKRAMNTGNSLDDKQFAERGSYTIAMSVHRYATEGRWHLVSLPVTLGLGRDADLNAVKFEGDEPKWEQPWYEVTVFYPGQVSWPMLNSRKHAGAERISKGVPVKYRHSEIQLAHYGLEVEFAEPIRRQWLYTLAGGVLLIFAFGFGLTTVLARKGA